MASLINRRQVRVFALDRAKATRAHKFTRVGDEFYAACEAELIAIISKKIQRLPSKGKTIV